jgi:hypothetical protein
VKYLTLTTFSSFLKVNMSNTIIQNLLEGAGFIDVVENPDHTFNGTKDGCRYENMWLSGWQSTPEMSDNAVVETIDVTVKYNKGSLS